MDLSPNAVRTAIEPLFRDNFARYGELGASIAIWHKGEPLLELHGGYRDSAHRHPWVDDTIVLVWSATKGIGAACLLHVLQEHQIRLDQRVAEFWPEFGKNGKSTVTLSQLLSHQSGLCALDKQVEISAYDDVIHAIEAQAPLWPPGTAHGYHARTFGFLLDELVRRIAGVPLSLYWRKIFAGPLDLDFWIGLPNELNERCATVQAPKADKDGEPHAFYQRLRQPGTIQHRTFTSPHGLNSIAAMNNPEMRALSAVSMSGIGSATALAKFYAMLANGGELTGHRFFSRETIQRMVTPLTDGIDSVFEVPTSFSAGFMKDPTGNQRRRFGASTTAFGHPGAGGSNAFADPENNLSFAYVMNQMEQSILPNDKCLRLVEALYALIHRSK